VQIDAVQPRRDWIGVLRFLSSPWIWTVPLLEFAIKTVAGEVRLHHAKMPVRCGP